MSKAALGGQFLSFCATTTAPPPSTEASSIDFESVYSACREPLLSFRVSRLPAWKIELPSEVS